MIFKNICVISGHEVLENAFIRTEGEIITYVGRQKPEAAAGEEVYDGTGKVALTGFYDMHCHIPMTYLRGHGEGLPLQRWLNEKIFPFEARLTGEDVYWASKLGAMELISSGCASFSDMYFFIKDIADAVDECGLKANLCHGISSFDPDVRLKDIKGYSDTVELSELIKDGAYGGIKGSGKGSRIRVDMGLHAEYTSTEGLVRQVAEAAKALGMSIHTHISETGSEHDECKKRHGGRTPVQYFNDCGLFEVNVNAAHCVYIEDADIDIMKKKNACAVHNPSSNMKLGSGFAPIKKFFERGLRVTVGTDGASSNNNLNMLEELHMAGMLARGLSKDANAISCGSLLSDMAYEGARMQGRADCGRLAEGYRADIIVIDLEKPHLQPVLDVMSNIVFSAQSSDVVLNMIDGRVVYKNGEFLTIDSERVFAEAKKRVNRILSEL